MKKMLITLLTFVVICTHAQKSVKLKMDTPPSSPTIFGEDIVSTRINERDFALSPDGSEIYYTISTPKSTFQTIVFMKKIREGEWTAPEVVSFAGEYSDLEPALSADGNTMYFSSNRPVSGNQVKDFDIWKVRREGSQWGKPENLGSPINTGEDEFYPSVAKNGNLYFTANYPGGPGKEDIYISLFSNNAWMKPVPLDTAVNSRYYEFNAFVAPDESFILFTSYARPDDTGSGDLYLSRKNSQGKWERAINLKELNSKQLDYCPYVSPDGRMLFFTSERHQLKSNYGPGKANYQGIVDALTNPLNSTGNLYWIDFRKLSH